MTSQLPANIEVLQGGRRAPLQVMDPIPVLDTGRFEQMQRIASIMAQSPLVPLSLRAVKKGTGADAPWDLLPTEVATANCFLVVNSAVRWNMDPFAVAQCCAVVHGRLMYEGKLVAAVIDSKLGIKLAYEFNDKTGDQFGIRVVGPSIEINGRVVERIVEGAVRDWKPNGKSAWDSASNHRRMLIYRGTREWTRLYEPALLLGVYTPDELEDMEDQIRAVTARPLITGEPQRAIEPPPRTTRRKKAEDTDPPASEATDAADATEAEAGGLAVKLARAAQEIVEDAVVDEQPNWWPLVGKVREDAQHARTMDELTDCFAPLHEADALPPDVDQLVETMWEDFAEKIRGAAKPPAEELPKDNPDFQRGVKDAAAGVTKCLSSAIKSDEERHRLWNLGYRAKVEGRV